MNGIAQVPVRTLDVERFSAVLPAEAYTAFLQEARKARELLDGRVVWNVNSTARGGGVAEMLRSLLAYARGVGVDARWVVIPGSPEFFAITKRIHNRLHGAEGDGGPLGEREREIYEGTLDPSCVELEALVGPRDVVIVHDPQPAGLVPVVRRIGCPVVWRCHVGLDIPNDLAREAWAFLIPYVSPADAYIFSRKAFAWEGLEGALARVIPPSIDAFSPKNQEMDGESMAAILAASGLVAGRADHEPRFTREDGSRGLVERPVELLDGGSAPSEADTIVTQVSRWDRLKDPLGVIRGFVDHVAPNHDAHLIVAGPAVAAVSDDPEGGEVLREARDLWATFGPAVRRRIHLACLPMEDAEENAAIVNALQRRSNVVVQKSLAEGFGLTVAEAMWKSRPVVASRIGGIQDQIHDGESGLLISDPHDLGEYGALVGKLLKDPASRERMGRLAQQRVRDRFLGARHLMQYVELIESLL